MAVQVALRLKVIAIGSADEDGYFSFSTRTRLINPRGHRIEVLACCEVRSTGETCGARFLIFDGQNAANGYRQCAMSTNVSGDAALRAARV